MSEEEKHKVLIVEDDVDVADMLNAYFRVQGYEVMTVNWGEDGVRAGQKSRPDLIILDIRLPDIDGYEVARRLRANPRTEGIPIIFLTEKRRRDERLMGLQLGADDYITKPFDVQELRLRVRNALRRVTQGTLNNPVTGQPEGVLVDERLSECLEDGSSCAFLIVSLENLESFREAYGFVASDDVVRAVSVMINNSVRDKGSPTDFVGHLSLTQFVILTQPQYVPGLKNRIRTRLDQSLDYFYPLKHRDTGQLPGERLTVRIGELISTEAKVFKSVSRLKAALVRELQ